MAMLQVETISLSYIPLYVDDDNEEDDGNNDDEDNGDVDDPGDGNQDLIHVSLEFWFTFLASTNLHLTTRTPLYFLYPTSLWISSSHEPLSNVAFLAS